MTELGERLALAGVPQTDVARQVGCSQALANMALAGRRRPLLPLVTCAEHAIHEAAVGALAACLTGASGEDPEGRLSAATGRLQSVVAEAWQLTQQTLDAPAPGD